MTALECNLINKDAIDINSTYIKDIKLCGFPDLTDYSGICHIRFDADSLMLMEIVVEIIASDIIRLKIPYNSYPTDISEGIYKYAVLLTKSDNTEQFYPIAGKCQLIKQVTY
jgi:hypothetical protein